MTTQSIDAVTSSSGVSPTTTTTAATASGFRQSFLSLASALQNGDVSGAQNALAALQSSASAVQGGANSVPALLGQSGSTLNQDLQAVSSALSSGNVGDAQKAFAKFEQDMQAQFQANASGGAGHAHHGHHGHHAHAAASSNTQTAQQSLITQLGQDTTSSSDAASVGSVVNTQA